MIDLFNGFYKGKRVLVTGVAGFIGSNLCKELKKRFEIYRDIVLINKLNLGFTSYGRKVL